MNKDTETILIVLGVAAVALYFVNKMNQPAPVTTVAVPKPVTTTTNPITAYSGAATTLINAGANLVNDL